MYYANPAAGGYGGVDSADNYGGVGVDAGDLDVADDADVCGDGVELTPLYLVHHLSSSGRIALDTEPNDLTFHLARGDWGSSHCCCC